MTIKDEIVALTTAMKLYYIRLYQADVAILKSTFKKQITEISGSVLLTYELREIKSLQGSTRKQVSDAAFIQLKALRDILFNQNKPKQ